MNTDQNMAVPAAVKLFLQIFGVNARLTRTVERFKRTGEFAKNVSPWSCTW